MRISDWSSDVCSSDLLQSQRTANEAPGLLHRINGDARPCDGKHVIATILGDDQTMPLGECELRTPEDCFHDQFDGGASGCDCDSAGFSACHGGNAGGALSCAQAYYSSGVAGPRLSASPSFSGGCTSRLL